jgi:hypothetical protein
MEEKPARIQSCSCYGGDARSLTVRTDYKNGWPADKPNPEPFQYSGYLPDPSLDDKHFISKAATCNVVSGALNLKDTDAGLIVISGGTGSLKTTVAMGLIHLQLLKLMKDWCADPKKRKPHLVTCEDNIESFFLGLGHQRWVEDAYQINVDCRKQWLTRMETPDYTPRKLGVDTPSLNAGVDDALRMKPSIFYGGEIRNHADWEELFRLALSHLVVVTTHASSLVSTFALFQRSLKVRHSSSRSEMASAIKAVIHMRPGSIGNVEFALPACWIRTGQSLAAYTSDGVASVVPELAEIPNGKGVYCFGRAAFAQAFQTSWEPPDTKKWNGSKRSSHFGEGPDDLAEDVCDADTNSKANFPPDLIKRATMWDLAGE